MKKWISQEPGNMSALFKLFWGFGNLGGGLIVGVVSAFQLIYYQNYLGLSADLYSACIVIYVLVNSFNNPFIAYMSDHSKNKKGRRTPYFRTSAPVVVVSFVMMFYVPIEANLIFKFWWLLICLIIHDIGYSLYCSMYQSLHAEITEYENERVDLQFSLEVFYYLGNIVGMVIPGLINPDFSNSSSLQDFRVWIFVIGLISLTMFMTTALVVKERVHLRSVENANGAKNVKSAIKEYYSIFKIKPVFLAIFTNFFASGAMAITTPLLYYIAMFVVKIDTTVFTLSIMLPMVFSLPIWKSIQRKYGSNKTAEIALKGAAVALILASLPLNRWITIVLFSSVGFFMAGYRLTLRMLICDGIDYDEFINGKRREGVIFGASGFVNIFTFMLTAIIPQVLKYSNFITAAENGGVNLIEQPDSAIWGIRGLILFCGLQVVVANILLSKYPLKGEKLKQVREAVLKMHNAKEQQMKQEVI